MKTKKSQFYRQFMPFFSFFFILTSSLIVSGNFLSMNHETPDLISFRISTIGDSLTRGVLGTDMGEHKWQPYTYQYYLYQTLEEQGYNSSIFNYGEPGERVEEIFSRINLTIPSDIIIIMAGTNDILADLNPETENFSNFFSPMIELYGNLLQFINEQHLNLGLDLPLIIVNSVPPFGANFFLPDNSNDAVIYFNDKLARYISELGLENVKYCDIHAEMSNSQNSIRPGLVFIDGVHFTQLGYQVLGEKVAECILDNYQSD